MSRYRSSVPSKSMTRRSKNDAIDRSNVSSASAPTRCASTLEPSIGRIRIVRRSPLPPTTPLYSKYPSSPHTRAVSPPSKTKSNPPSSRLAAAAAARSNGCDKKFPKSLESNVNHALPRAGRFNNIPRIPTAASTSNAHGSSTMNSMFRHVMRPRRRPRRPGNLHSAHLPSRDRGLDRRVDHHAHAAVRFQHQRRLQRRLGDARDGDGRVQHGRDREPEKR